MGVIYLNEQQEYYSLHYKGRKRKRRTIYPEKRLSFFDALQLVKYKDGFEEIALDRETSLNFIFIEDNTHQSINCTFHPPKQMSVKEHNTHCCQDRSSHVLTYFLIRKEEKVTFLSYKRPPKHRNKAIKEPTAPYKSSQ